MLRQLEQSGDAAGFRIRIREQCRVTAPDGVHFLLAVLSGGLRVAPQVVPDPQVVRPVFAVPDDDREVKSMLPPLAEIQPSRDARFSESFIPQLGQPVRYRAVQLQRPNPDEDVDDRLRGHARDRRAAEMPDVDGVVHEHAPQLLLLHFNPSSTVTR